MHGNERSSVSTLISWVDELERNYSQIPADKTVVVLPNVNPDAYTANRRTNINNVDLNRNFPSNDLSQHAYLPGNTYLENGGGLSALSESESSALANYIDSISADVVLTYHAVARAVIFNGSGNSADLAQINGSNTGFSSYSSSNEDGIFGCPTTGEFETWLHEKRGIPTLLIELATMSSNEISTQKSGMWFILR